MFALGLAGLTAFLMRSYLIGNSGTADAPANTVQLRLKDGADGERHRITLRCAVDNGDALEGELQARDIR